MKLRTAMAALVLSVLSSSAALALGCADNDPATSVTLPGGGCFSFHASPNPQAGAPLVVFMHGDGGGSIGSSYWEQLTKTGDQIAADTRTTFVVLVRPGYRGPGGRSSGEAKTGDDDYTASNVKLAADAIGALKAKFRASRVIVAGNSGGAATAALIMGRHPGVADDAWLVACPCQVQPWRAWRMQSAGRTTPWSSLSPDQHVAGIAATARFAVVVGGNDTNTLSKFSEAYVAVLKARGVAAGLTIVSGGTHGGTWRTPESIAALTSLLR
jgi:pimeloyl-ACP methyl ester carboxylesterase